MKPIKIFPYRQRPLGNPGDPTLFICGVDGCMYKQFKTKENKNAIHKRRTESF